MQEVINRNLPRESPGAGIDTIAFIAVFVGIPMYSLVGLLLSYTYMALTSLTIYPDITGESFLFLIVSSPLIIYSLFALVAGRKAYDNNMVIFIMFITAFIIVPFLMSLFSLIISTFMENNIILGIIAEIAYTQRYYGIVIAIIPMAIGYLTYKCYKLYKLE